MIDEDDPLEGHDLDDVLLVKALMGWDGIQCATCSRPLGTDPDDDPTGDAALPICGECNRARNLDVREGPAEVDVPRGAS